MVCTLQRVIIFVLLCFTIHALAISPQEDTLPLSAEQAFAFSAKVINHDTLALEWNIANGYYLYQDLLKFKITSPTTAALGAVSLPPAQKFNNELIGKHPVYTNKLQIVLPIRDPTPTQLSLAISYQGCSKNGLCYPPITQLAIVNFTNSTVFIRLLRKLAEVGQQQSASNTAPRAYTRVRDEASTDATPLMPTIVESPKKSIQPAQATEIYQLSNQTTSDNTTRLAVNKLFSFNSLWLTYLTFLGLGILLAFTPCVLPMIPILSTIIVGQRQPLNKLKAFNLSVVYVLSMSLAFAVAGAIAGSVGYSIQAALQMPWLIASSSLIFVILALSLFGFYDLQLPNFFRQRLIIISQKQIAGSYVNAIIMGLLGSLIISPCVSAPLVAALSYIGITGNAITGGMVLFCMGIGMGLPLLVIGTLGGQFLPKAGPWMETIKIILGFALIAIAISLINRIIPKSLTLVSWGIFFIIIGTYLSWLPLMTRKLQYLLWRGLGIAIITYGILMLIGAAEGQINPWQPLSHTDYILATDSDLVVRNSFVKVSSAIELQEQLRLAKDNNQAAVVDFYADWCLECQAMEHSVFQNTQVQSALAGMKLIKADVTVNNTDTRILQKDYGIYGPPTVLFFNPQGKEQVNARIIGGVDAKTFLQTVKATLL